MAAGPAEPSAAACFTGPVDASVVPRFAGPDTFARLPRIDEVSDVDVAIVGVPFDTGVSYRPGARFGPAHIRQSSKLLRL
jgi:agmatinase